MPSPDISTRQLVGNINLPSSQNEKGELLHKGKVESIDPISSIGQMVSKEGFVHNPPTFVPTMIPQFTQPSIVPSFPQPILQPVVQPVLHAIHQPLHPTIPVSSMGPTMPAQPVTMASTDMPFRYFPPINSSNIPALDIGSQPNLLQTNSSSGLDNHASMPSYFPTMRNRSPSDSALSDNYSLGSSYNYGSQRLFGATSPAFSLRNGESKLDFSKVSTSNP